MNKCNLRRERKVPSEGEDVTFAGRLFQMLAPAMHQEGSIANSQQSSARQMASKWPRKRWLLYITATVYGAICWSGRYILYVFIRLSSCHTNILGE
jgi:hypothetical protein